MFQQPFVAGPVLPEVVQIDLNSSLLNNKVSAAVEGSFAVNPQRAKYAASLPLFRPVVQHLLFTAESRSSRRVVFSRSRKL